MWCMVYRELGVDTITVNFFIHARDMGIAVKTNVCGPPLVILEKFASREQQVMAGTTACGRHHWYGFCMVTRSWWTLQYQSVLPENLQIRQKYAMMVMRGKCQLPVSVDEGCMWLVPLDLKMLFLSEQHREPSQSKWRSELPGNTSSMDPGEILSDM
eukprot:g36326.t1